MYWILGIKDTWTQTIPHICHLDHLYIGGEKIGHVEKFQISIHNRCGEIRNFARFGGISKFYTWQMWRNLKFILFLVVKSVLWQFTLFFAWIVLSRFMRLCVERNWAKNCIGGEKMTNMRYAPLYLKAQFTLICTVINNPYKVPDHSADVAAAWGAPVTAWSCFTWRLYVQLRTETKGAHTFSWGSALHEDCMYN